MKRWSVLWYWRLWFWREYYAIHRPDLSRRAAAKDALRLARRVR